MAKQIITQLIDDMTGEVLPEGEGETIRFGVNGVSYTIDLGRESARQFREALAPYVENAEREPGTTRSSIEPRRSSPRTDPEQVKAVRDWARDNGYQVSDRGRIPTRVLEAYHDQAG
ncbi:histone-like nucleoid-structuring protein Lsr2 [Propionibacteriaceae bacterium Y2011]|uniref:histone-like nucleoid-structuring protein Lsr2 n=1 Tax=Microlunatus sp. Y2014 TaxID=3418488 RepID=UPI003B486F15